MHFYYKFTIAVDAVEFQKMLETLAKGDLRSLGFDQNKPFDIPSDSERSVVSLSKKTPKKVRTRNPPSPPDRGSDDEGSDGDNNPGGDNPNFGREKSPGQQSWERATGILSEPIKHTGLGSIKVDPPEMMNGSDKKWRDAQKFDG